MDLFKQQPVDDDFTKIVAQHQQGFSLQTILSQRFCLVLSKSKSQRSVEIVEHLFKIGMMNRIEIKPIGQRVNPECLGKWIGSLINPLGEGRNFCE